MTIDSRPVGIVLSMPFHWALERRAKIDGYITDAPSWQGLNIQYLDSITKNALQMLLIYDKSYVIRDKEWRLEVENTDRDPRRNKLVMEGLIEYEIVEKKPSFEMSQKAFFRKYIEYSELIEPEVIEAIKFRTGGRQLSRADYYLTLTGLAEDFSILDRCDPLVRDKAWHKLEHYNGKGRILPDAVNSAEFWLEYYSAMRNLIGSNELGVPIAVLTQPRGYTKASVEPRKPTQIDSLYQAFQIFLEEIEFVPRLTKIDDVLRLRGDKRIKNFRETLYQWSLILREGNIAAERRIRHDIREANKGLKQLGEWEKVGQWVTYISLPLSVASVFIGMPLGLVLTPISLTSRVYTDLQKRKYRWLMIGR